MHYNTASGTKLKDVPLHVD